MSATKPFTISKQQVYEAFKAVKANAGAAGVDKQSIEDFERNLKDNLYQDLEPDVVGDLLPAAGQSGRHPEKGWRGTNSWCADGSGPRGADGCQDGIRTELEPIFLPDSYGYRPGKSALDAVGVRESGAGDMIGF